MLSESLSLLATIHCEPCQSGHRQGKVGEASNGRRQARFVDGTGCQRVVAQNSGGLDIVHRDKGASNSGLMVLAREAGEIFVEGGLTAAESGAVVVTAQRFNAPVNRHRVGG